MSIQQQYYILGFLKHLGQKYRGKKRKCWKNNNLSYLHRESDLMQRWYHALNSRQWHFSCSFILIFLVFSFSSVPFYSYRTEKIISSRFWPIISFHCQRKLIDPDGERWKRKCMIQYAKMIPKKRKGLFYDQCLQKFKHDKLDSISS